MREGVRGAEPPERAPPREAPGGRRKRAPLPHAPDACDDNHEKGYGSKATLRKHIWHKHDKIKWPCTVPDCGRAGEDGLSKKCALKKHLELCRPSHFSLITLSLCRPKISLLTCPNHPGTPLHPTHTPSTHLPGRMPGRMVIDLPGRMVIDLPGRKVIDLPGRKVIDFFIPKSTHFSSAQSRRIGIGFNV